ncbi:tripartite motif-containing protein 16-like [Synchiropus picturatus]
MWPSPHLCWLPWQPLKVQSFTGIITWFQGTLAEEETNRSDQILEDHVTQRSEHKYLKGVRSQSVVSEMEARAEVLSCSICLDLLKDPVTLNCGHSFCQVCVEGYWDSEDERNICRCPQCRRTFRRRPRLQKNVMLAELVEDLKKTGLQAADLCYAGPEDVACDSCTGRKLKALKSCLVCLTSYCEQHLQPHLEAPAFRRHKLVQPSKQLQEILCPQHDKVKKMFCRTDQQVICHLCAVDQHKDHHIVSAAAERREREKEVDQSRGRIQQRIQERQEELKLLQQEQKTIRDSADKAVKESQETLQRLIQDLQRRMSDVEQQIRSQQDTEAAVVQGLQEQLEQEIAELKKKDAELQQLSLTDSHLVFLQNWSSLSEVSEDTFSSRTHVRLHCCFEEVAAAVSASRERLQDLLKDTCTNISLMLAPQTRAEFLRFSRDITLDPNTAHSEFLLSEGNRKVRDTWKDQSPPHHPDRFTDYPQVLSKEPLTGRCYWEVEWRGEVAVAVSYKSISRSGGESEFGDNEKSWSLWCRDSGCSFTHNSIRTQVSTAPPSRVGVYLDHSAGLLSFYSVSGTMALLHRVHTTFTQPLHAGLGVWAWSSSCEILKLN